MAEDILKVTKLSEIPADYTGTIDHPCAYLWLVNGKPSRKGSKPVTYKPMTYLQIGEFNSELAAWTAGKKGK